MRERAGEGRGGGTGVRRRGRKEKSWESKGKGNSARRVQGKGLGRQGSGPRLKAYGFRVRAEVVRVQGSGFWEARRSHQS